MFSFFFSKKPLNPLEAFHRVEAVLQPIQQEEFLFKGVLVPKEKKKNYSIYALKITESLIEEEPSESEQEIDLSKVTLQVFERNKKDSVLADAVNWEVVLSGCLEIKIWKDSSTAAICLREPTLLKKIQPIQLQSSDEINEIRSLFQQNPASKPRDEKLIEELSSKLARKSKLSVLVYGPAGKGRDDILTEFSRAEGIENFIRLYTVDKTLSPPSLNIKKSKEHFKKICEELEGYSQTGEYDLICLARGGGDPFQLASLNNKELCEAIIRLPTPVCISIAHSSDELWLKESGDMFTNVPALFISELVRVVEKVYPGEIKVSAMQTRKQFLSSGLPQKIIWVLLLASLAVLAWFVFR